MFKLKSSKNQKINEILLVQILFYTFPLWFIVGNFAISLNTLLFIVVSLFVIQRKQLTFRFDNSCWLLVAFFLYFSILTTNQYLSPGYLNDTMQLLNLSLEDNPIFKSFLLIRFVILIFVIDTLFFNKILNLEKFCLFSFLCTIFVCFDIMLQYMTGFDIFGYKREGSWNMGPFGDEWIAGTYLKNFSFFSLFYIFKTFKNKNFNIPLLIFVITLHLIAILLSGNKMALLLFLFGCVLIILLIKNLRFVMSLSLFIFMSVFFLLINFDSYENTNYYKDSYKRFASEINIEKLIEASKNISKKQDAKKIELDVKEPADVSSNTPQDMVLFRYSGYNRIFRTAIEMWKEQPLFGFGAKSFRFKCWDMLAKDNAKRKITKKPQYIGCANHPHNYYLELLSEAGIIGTLLMVVFFLILLKYSFFYVKKYYQKNSTELILLVPVIINILIEIWPLRSSGSFFTTGNATFFWLMVGILLATNVHNRINKS